MIILAAYVILGLIAATSGLMVLVLGVTLLKRKIRKEWGLFLRHLAFHPKPPSKQRVLENPWKSA
jgi:hypothetical protein